MHDLALPDGGMIGGGIELPRLEIPKIQLVIPRWFMPTKFGTEVIWDELDAPERKILDKVLHKGRSLKERILMMAGSDANYLTKALADLAFGKTAYAGETTIYNGLWTAALDDTFNGATTGEANYTSYGRLALTNNTTIFPVGTGTTTYAKSWPGDAAKNWPTATGALGSPVTYFGALNGNAGSSADKGMVWASVTSTSIGSGDTPQLAQNAITQTRD